MSLADRLCHIAEHIGDDQPNLPEGAKNDLLLAAKALDLLKSVEFVYDSGYDSHYCPTCHAIDDPGKHMDGCQMGLLAKRLTQPTKDKV